MDFLTGAAWEREHTGINSIENNFSAQYYNNLFNMTKYVRSKCEGTILYRIAQWTSHNRSFAIASSHGRRKCENASGFIGTHTHPHWDFTIPYIPPVHYLWLLVPILIDYCFSSRAVLEIGLWYNCLSRSQYVGKWLVHFFIIIIAFITFVIKGNTVIYWPIWVLKNGSRNIYIYITQNNFSRDWVEVEST